MHALVAEFSLIVPYYRNPGMLMEHIRAWEGYPPEVKLIVVDDGSPETAEDVLRAHASRELLGRVELFRVDVDIPWNRGGARNLGSKQATTKWLLHVDIDHVLPPECVQPLLRFEANNKRWYRFKRYRNGAADDTRRKDAIPDDQAFGEVKPHCDSYLCTSRAYWENGGYDEDYSGCLGGGNPFLKRMMGISALEIAPDDVCLHVYTRSVVEDSSDWALSRDPAEYSRRKRLKHRNGNTVPRSPIRFPWHRVEFMYPKVYDEFETLAKLEEGYSVARFGDGEFKLIDGKAQIREPANRNLAGALNSVLNDPHPMCLVAIPTMRKDGPKYESWRRHSRRFARILNSEKAYYSAFISRPDSAPWINTGEFAQRFAALWRDKRVVLVSEQDTSIYRLLAATTDRFAHVPCPHRETFAVLPEIRAQVLAARPEIAVLSCGPSATVLANQLAGDGIQAIDAGSAGQFVLSHMK